MPHRPLVMFDCVRFRQDVLDFIHRFNLINGYGGRQYVKKKANVGASAVSRLVDSPGKISSINAVISIAKVCELDIDSYFVERQLEGDFDATRKYAKV